MSRQFVFVDARLTDYQALAATLAQDAAVVVLDATRDGIEQIAAILAGVTDLEAIHIVGHGAPGAVHLGSAVLDQAASAGYSQALAAIGASLTPTGDLLLYGCNVAQGAPGREFIAQLAQLTGADVAASDDLTGAAAQGGDWRLEASVGTVEAQALSAPGYQYVLAANSAPSFVAGGGTLTTDLGGMEYAQGMCLQADGSILATGPTDNTTNGDSDFGVVRYTAAGALDASFSGDGLAITPLAGSDDYSYAVLTQADGRILVAGNSWVGGGYSFSLARYASDGSLDTSFDTDGKLTTDFGHNSDYGLALAVQTDSKILVAGEASNGADYDFAVARYTTDGTLDTTFSGDGLASTDFGIASGSDSATCIALQSDGKLVLAGYAGGASNNSIDFAVVRYNSDGTLDTGFDSDGKLTTDFAADWDQANAIAVQTDGKIVVAGKTGDGNNNDFALARYNSDGTLDTGFDGDGKLTTDFAGASDEANAMALQADGKIVLAGRSWDANGVVTFALARYNSDGSLDTSFDGDGRVTTAFTGNGTVMAMAVQADGKIVVAGSGGLDFALARYNADGSLDATFAGANTLDGAPAFTEGGAAVVLDGNVQVVDAELASGNYSGATLTLARHGGANAADTYAAASGGTLGSLIEGGNLSVGATTIGTVTANASGTLTLTFNANATQSLINAALQQIAYANGADAPTASVRLDWTFDDGNSGAQGTGGALSATGSTTVAITGVNDAPTGGVSVTGTAQSGQTLTAANSLADADGLGSIIYHWQVSANGSSGWSDIGGATGSSHVLDTGEVGKYVRVLAAYVDGGGTAESAASAATTMVAAAATAPDFSAAGVDWATYDWGTVDWSQVDATDAAAIDWSRVDWSDLAAKPETYDQLDWGKVDWTEMSADPAQFDRIDWGRVDWQDMSADSAAEWEAIDWGKVDWTDIAASDATQFENIAWSFVDFGKMAAADAAQWQAIDWGQVRWDEVGSADATQYQDIDWAEVQFDELSATDLAEWQAIDWGQVQWTEFSPATYDGIVVENVDWTDLANDAWDSIDMQAFDPQAIRWADLGYESTADHSASAEPQVMDFTAGGDEGNDKALGGAGGDTAILGKGFDYFDGGAGNDSADGGAGIDDLIGGTGNDTMGGGADADILDGGSGRDVLSGGAGTDELGGGMGADSLAGGGGADTIAGGGGADTLGGGGGADYLAGGGGADVVRGGLGDDIVVGGAGADTLTGGGGSDTFAFAAYADMGGAAAADVILDFVAAADKIDFASLDADANADGDQAFAFVGEFDASDATGQVCFKDGYVLISTDADTDAEFMIRVDVVGTLDGASFVL